MRGLLLPRRVAYRVGHAEVPVHYLHRAVERRAYAHGGQGAVVVDEVLDAEVREYVADLLLQGRYLGGATGKEHRFDPLLLEPHLLGPLYHVEYEAVYELVEVVLIQYGLELI